MLALILKKFAIKPDDKDTMQVAADFADDNGDLACANSLRWAATQETTIQSVYGLQAVRRAQNKAEKNGWQIEIIENTNGCYGMYARTDAKITRPFSIDDLLEKYSEELEELEKQRQEAEKLELEKQRIEDFKLALQIVPVDLLRYSWRSASGRVYVKTKACENLGLDCTPLTSSPYKQKKYKSLNRRAYLNEVLKAHYPSLDNKLRKSIYQSVGLCSEVGSRYFPDCKLQSPRLCRGLFMNANKKDKNHDFRVPRRIKARS